MTNYHREERISIRYSWYTRERSTDYRLQEQDEYTNRWRDVYYFDNEMHSFAIEDNEDLNG